MPASAEFCHVLRKRGELKKKICNISVEKSKKRRRSRAVLMVNRLRCQKWAKWHCRSREKVLQRRTWRTRSSSCLCCPDRVELRAKKSQLNLESIFPSAGAFSGTNRERWARTNSFCMWGFSVRASLSQLILVTGIDLRAVLQVGAVSGQAPWPNGRTKVKMQMVKASDLCFLNQATWEQKTWALTKTGQAEAWFFSRNPFFFFSLKKKGEQTKKQKSKVLDAD